MFEYLLISLLAIVTLCILITIEPNPSKDTDIITLITFGVCFLILSPIILIVTLILKLIRND